MRGPHPLHSTPLSGIFLRIISAVLEEPGIWLKDLPEKVGCNPSNVHKYVLDLCAAWIIERIRDGRRFRLYEKRGQAPIKGREPGLYHGIWQINDAALNKGRGSTFLMKWIE